LLSSTCSTEILSGNGPDIFNTLQDRLKPE